MAAVTICSDFGAPKIKYDTVFTVSPSICHEVMGPDAMLFVFWMLSFKPTFTFFFKFYFIFKLYNIVLVLPNIEMNPPQVYMCSPSWTLLPYPSPYHPSGSSQCTSPKHPVSCIEPGLVTCSIYDIIRISTPFSQIIPPSHAQENQKFWYAHSVLRAITC